MVHFQLVCLFGFLLSLLSGVCFFFFLFVWVGGGFSGLWVYVFFIQNNIAMTSPVLKQVQILYVCLNLLHMAGSRAFSFKGQNSGNRYFINLNEQGPRPGIIHIWLLYFNTVIKSQNLSVKPKQPNILLQKVTLLNCLQLQSIFSMLYKF